MAGSMAGNSTSSHCQKKSSLRNELANCIAGVDPGENAMKLAKGKVGKREGKKDEEDEASARPSGVLYLDWDDTLCPSTYCRRELHSQLIAQAWQKCHHPNVFRKNVSKEEEEDDAIPDELSCADGGSTSTASACDDNIPRRASTIPATAAASVSSQSMVPSQPVGGYSGYAPGEQQGKKKMMKTTDDSLTNLPPNLEEVEATPALIQDIELLRQQLISEETRRDLEELGVTLYTFLKHARSVAREVIIITNAEPGWITLSCLAWIPRSYSEVIKCRITSARARCETPRGEEFLTILHSQLQPSPPPARMWKRVAFCDHMLRVLYEDWRSRWRSRMQNAPSSTNHITAVSFGDAPHEREALFNIEGDLDRLLYVKKKELRTKIAAAHQLHDHDATEARELRAPEEEFSAYLNYLDTSRPTIVPFNARFALAPSIQLCKAQLQLFLPKDYGSSSNNSTNSVENPNPGKPCTTSLLQSFLWTREDATDGGTATVPQEVDLECLLGPIG